MNKKFVIFVSFILALSSLFYCQKKKTQPEKIKVAVSIPPLAEFVEKIGGDKVDVTIMVPLGTSPHNYEPTPQQMVAVSHARCFVKVGTPLEFELIWMDKILQNNPDLFVINASEGIFSNQDLSQGKNIDPHIWVSPLNAMKIVQNINAGLAYLMPDLAEFFSQNTKGYLDSLRQVDKLIAQKLAKMPQKLMIVNHPEWGYFAERYGLKMAAIEQEGKSPTISALKQLIDLARRNKIKVILTGIGESNRMAKVVAREIGAKVVTVSALNKNYIENLIRLTEILVHETK